MKDRDITSPKFKGDASTIATLSDTERPVGFLTITSGNSLGQVYPIILGKTVIGRGSENAIRLNDTQVSRQHLEIEATSAGVTARDLKTTNGSFLDGKTIGTKALPIKHGAEITLGLTTMQYAAARLSSWVTGIENIHDHDFFLHRLSEEIDRAHRYERAVTVMMLHIPSENLKMKTVVGRLKEKLRTMDIVATYGQRDLELILPEMNKTQAKEFARTVVKHLGVQTATKCGISTFPNDATSRDELIELSRQPLWLEDSNRIEVSERHELGNVPAGAISEANPRMILCSEKMRSLIQTAMRIAPTPIAVLIQGETGTGKELVAEAIHLNSDRKSKPFMAINCGAFTHNLLESELFGHEKGSFTGADQRKIGLVEAVAGGTLFMDEIGEIPPPLQVKLLRVLQESAVRRVGSNETIKVNFRIISATNRNLKKLVDTAAFREDLYYRLNAIVLEVPPLRERVEEIPLLANYFLNQYKIAYRKTDVQLAKPTIEALCKYPWPGNIRELKNAMERAVVITPGGVIYPENLNLPTPRIVIPKTEPKQSTDTTFAGDMRPMLDDYEKQLLLNALQKTGWNQTKAAEVLKIPRRTLVSKLKKHKIHRHE